MTYNLFNGIFLQEKYLKKSVVEYRPSQIQFLKESMVYIVLAKLG